MSNDQIDYEAIRQRAEKRVRQRIEFVQHLSIYVIVNLILWALWFIGANALHSWVMEFPWPILVTLIWGVALAIHGAVVYTQTNMMDAMRETAIQQEVEREMRLRGMDTQAAELEKPKRDRAVRLSDDGEIVPVDEIEDDRPHKTNRQSR